MTTSDGASDSQERIGPYRLINQIGEGGMGIVHLGLDRAGRAVAIKVLREHIAHDPEARARLAREVDTLRRVQHPLVAEVIDADLDAVRPYVVTQFVNGPGLDAVVRDDGPLSSDRLTALGRGLSEALGAVHAAGVVHRDLKPGNVLMLDGRPIVIDFGIAHIADDVRLTTVGLVMGTPGYLSPEVVDGDPVTTATDWWGWAATLAFAASGHPPFGRGPMEVVIDRVRRGETDLDGVDPRLRPLLAAALSVDPAARPGAEVVLAGLERYAAGQDTTAVLTSSTVRLPVDGATVVLPAEATEPLVALPATARPGGSAGGVALGGADAPQTVSPLAAAGQRAPAQEVLSWASPPADEPPMVGGMGAEPAAGIGAVGPQAGDPLVGDAVGATAASGRRARSGTLLVVLLALVCGAAAWPVATALVALALMILARSVDRGRTALARRRDGRGVRRTDGLVAIVAAPWHLFAGTLATVLTCLLPAALGVATVFLAGLALSPDGTPSPGSSPAIAAGALIALLAVWWGPGGRSLRRGARALTPTRSARVVVPLLLLTAAAAVAVAVNSGQPDLTPWGNQIRVDLVR